LLVGELQKSVGKIDLLTMKLLKLRFGGEKSGEWKVEQMVSRCSPPGGVPRLVVEGQKVRKKI